MRGFITHISDPKRSTACTTALKNILDTLGFAPSLPKIIDNRTYLVLKLCRFLTNSGQESSNDTMIRPRYFNDITEFSDIMWAWKTLAVLAVISSAIRRSSDLRVRTEIPSVLTLRSEERRIVLLS